MEKIEFFIFDNFGKLNKKELTLFLARLNKNFETISPMNFKVLTPCQGSNLKKIDHLSLKFFGNQITEPNEVFENNQNSLLFGKPFSVKNLKLNENNSNFTFSRIIFEIPYDKEFVSAKIEKCIFFTGILLSNFILINIPIDEILWPNRNRLFDHILKIFYNYSRGVENGLISLDDTKEFVILVSGDLIESDNTEIRKNLMDQIFNYLEKIKKECFKEIRRNHPDFNLKNHNSESFKFSIHFLCDPYYFKENYQKEIADFKDWISQNGKETYCEHQILNKPGNIIHENGNLNEKKFEYVEIEFVNFEKYIRIYSQYLPDWKRMGIETPRDLIAGMACQSLDRIISMVMKEFFQKWKINISGGYCQNFTKEMNFLIEEIEKFYEKENIFFKKSEVYKRKLKVIKEIIHTDLRILFLKQLTHIKKNLLNSFKRNLANIPINEEIEKNINNSINFTETAFSEKAFQNIPNFKKNLWNFDGEKRNFKNIMREAADEKLKVAKFKGLIFKKPRQIVSISFHALFPHPFGKDLTNEPFTFDDTFVYDPKHHIEKADLMRHVTQIYNPSESFPSKYKSLMGNLKEEDIVFKENPMEALKQ